MEIYKLRFISIKTYFDWNGIRTVIKYKSPLISEHIERKICMKSSKSVEMGRGPLLFVLFYLKNSLQLLLFCRAIICTYFYKERTSCICALKKEIPHPPPSRHTPPVIAPHPPVIAPHHHTPALNHQLALARLLSRSRETNSGRLCPYHWRTLPITGRYGYEGKRNSSGCKIKNNIILFKT